MPSAYAYTALGPDYADFAQPLRDLGPSATGASSPSPSEECLTRKTGKRSRLRAVAETIGDVFRGNVGLLLVVASQAFLSLVNVAVKKLNSIDPPVSTFELILVRMTITYICSVTYMLSTGVPDPFIGPKGVRLLLVFRGFSGFFGLFGIYYSLQYLSLSDATVLTFLSPLCTAAAGSLFLGEKFTRKEALAGLLSLVGVVLIARPPFIFGDNASDHLAFSSAEEVPTGPTSAQRLSAVGVSLLGVLGSTGAYTSLSAIVIVASIGMVITKTPFIVPTRLDWLALLVMIGIFGFLAQVLLAMGLARETAGRGSMAIYTLIVFATILERIFFQTIPSALSVIGTIVIIASALFIAVTKEKEPSSKSNKETIRLRNGAEDVLERGLLQRDSEADEDQQGMQEKPGEA